MTDRTKLERNRRYRERRRKNICVVMVEIGMDELDTLIEAGHLAEVDSENPFKIAVAVNKLMTRHAHR